MCPSLSPANSDAHLSYFLLHFSSVCRLQNLDSNSFKFFIFYFVQLYLLNLVLLCLSSGTDFILKRKRKKDVLKSSSLFAQAFQ